MLHTVCRKGEEGKRSPFLPPPFLSAVLRPPPSLFLLLYVRTVVHTRYTQREGARLFPPTSFPFLSCNEGEGEGVPKKGI